MTLARLLLEIRRRAAALPDDDRRPQAIERIAREILAKIPEGQQADQVRRILAAFLGLGDGDEFDAALLNQMTPELVLRLDMLLVAFLDLGHTNEAVQALDYPVQAESIGPADPRAPGYTGTYTPPAPYDVRGARKR